MSPSRRGGRHLVLALLPRAPLFVSLCCLAESDNNNKTNFQQSWWKEKRAQCFLAEGWDVTRLSAIPGTHCTQCQQIWRGGVILMVALWKSWLLQSLYTMGMRCRVVWVLCSVFFFSHIPAILKGGRRQPWVSPRDSACCSHHARVADGIEELLLCASVFHSMIKSSALCQHNCYSTEMCKD